MRRGEVDPLGDRKCGRPRPGRRDVGAAGRNRDDPLDRERGIDGDGVAADLDEAVLALPVGRRDAGDDVLDVSTRSAAFEMSWRLRGVAVEGLQERGTDALLLDRRDDFAGRRRRSAGNRRGAGP